MNQSTTTHHWISDVILLCLLVGSVFAFMLGSRPLNVPDESRYSEIPREMLVTHDFITPRINGIKYFEKPPLFYWMQAASLKAFGYSEWACRLVNALMGLLGIIATYLTTRKLFDRKTGLLASAILTTSFLYFGMAHVITLDMTVSVFLTITLLSFIVGAQYPPSSTRRIYFYIMYIAAALAVLTKGLIGIVLPGGIVFVWLLMTNHWRELKHCYLPTGTVLFLLVAAPWHILVQQANPEFFHFYFIEQHFLRYLTKNAGRYHPFFVYIPVVLFGVFPWTGFLVGAFKRIRRNQSIEMFLLIWAIFIFLFFSFSDSKLVPYVLPCIPPMAILLAKYFADSPNDKLGYWTISFTCIVLATAIPIALHYVPTTNDTQAKLCASIMMLVLILNAIAIPWIFSCKGFLIAFKTQLIFTLLYSFSLCAIAPYIYMDSIKPLALKLKPILKPDDIVASYDFYYQDLPFYLQRIVTIVNWHGELTFGQAHQDPGQRMVSDKAFWPVWNSHKTVYLMLDKRKLPILKLEYPYQFYPIANYGTDILVSNHEVQPW